MSRICQGVHMRIIATASLVLSLATAGFAHHGGASTSQGPGTPIETNSPLTLPKGGTVVFTRAELVPFQKFDRFNPENIDSFDFFQLGVSHGLTDYLTATAILPYNSKTQDSFGNLQGVGDGKLLMTLGFNYSDDEGFQLNGEEDTAVNLGESNKTYFGLIGGLTAPSGRSDLQLQGVVDGGLQPGFGTPTATLGLAMTRGLSERLSVSADASVELFSRKSGGDKFGNEFRANLAGVYELHADKESWLRRVDGILELNYLVISRDETAFVSELATGGRILYLSPGVRFQLGDVNLGALVKFPIVRGLNERMMQQGSEGLEQYRLIFTVSTFF